MDIQGVFTHGNLVDLNIGFWNGKKQIMSEDLGLAKGTISTVFSLGNKSLISSDVARRFKNLDYQARYLLELNSFKFPFGTARFVPKKNMVEFSERLHKIIDAFNEESDRFCREYDKEKLAMREEYVRAANDAFDRAQLLCGFAATRDEFVTEYLSRIDGFYPDLASLREKFYMEYVVFEVALPDISRASYGDILEEDQKLKLLEETYKKSIYRKAEQFVQSVVEETRSKVLEVLNRSKVSIQKGSMRGTTIKMLAKLSDNFEHMDIMEDVKFRKMLQDFKSRLSAISLEDLKDNKAVRASVLDDIKMLIAYAENKEEMDALVIRYRETIKL